MYSGRSPIRQGRLVCGGSSGLDRLTFYYNIRIIISASEETIRMIDTLYYSTQLAPPRGSD